MKQKRFTTFIKRLSEHFADYSIECIYLFIAIFIVRIYETTALFIFNYDSPLIVNNLEGAFIDISVVAPFLLAGFVIYFALGFISTKISKYFTRTIFATYLCTSALLVGYFATTHIPLDNIITAYSTNELFITIKANNPYNILIISAIIILSIIFIIIPRRKISIPRWAKIIMIVIMAGSCFVPNIDRKFFRYDKEFYIVENKVRYFAKTLAEKKSIIQFTDNELKIKANEFYKYFPEYNFTDYKHPFLHKDSTPDILSEYLEANSQKPNIVYIIVEGLCNYISGKNCTVTSATPFLDSLSEHSLVWENCLSTSERTFAVLPSLLGALPFGTQGFMSYRYDMPNFNSIATILNKNGYKNTFFYGGWYGFDNMDVFAKLNNLEMYYFNPKYDSVSKRNQWGLYDEYMLENSLEAIKSDNTKPRFDVYLTLTTHDPFEYPNKEKYIEKYLTFQNISKKKLIVKKSLNEYASFVYIDECLKSFFEKYQKIDSYSNTIFVITGDHKFFNFNETNPTDNFQVPLIIWSPMLKKSMRFPALTSHRNVSPSILAFLKNNFGIITPKNSVALNKGLDTSQYWQAKTFSPLYNANRQLKCLIYNQYLITNENVFTIENTNNTIEIRENGNQNLKALLELYQQLDNYIMNNNALISNENK